MKTPDPTGDPMIARSHNPTRQAAIGWAFLVVLVWSTSWVLIRIGLKEIPALTFAGLRYTIAAICLAPFLLTKRSRQAIRQLNRNQWGQLLALGVVLYAVAQGSQYLSLSFLPLATTSLIINLTALATAIVGLVILSESPTRLQWIGITLNLGGIAMFFYPPAFSDRDGLGIAIAMVCMLANTAGTIMGRSLNRMGSIPPLILTGISMGVGAVLMLGVGLSIEGIPTISPLNWAAIVWMAVVNTAMAFTLWNYTQRTLQATESSIIANMMTVFVAILGWIFVREGLSTLDIFGIVAATIGTMLVQIRRFRQINLQTGT